MARADEYEYLDWPGPIPWAHRGGASEHPENTMPAFEHAVRLGYRYLETDVHATSDGVLLAFHDDVLDRVTDRTGVIAELPWSEVQRARVAGTEPIPLFADLLTSFPAARINVDAKRDNAVAPLVETIKQAGALGRICLTAFSDTRLTRMRRALPGACSAMGPRQIARLVAASRGVPTGRFSAACAQVPTRHAKVEIVTERFVATAHRKGLHVHVWTIDEADEMERLLDLGVDGIMTDRPQVLRDVLQRRGQWVQP